MDQVFLHLGSVIFAGVFLGLEGQHGERAFPRSESNRLADPLVAFLPHLVVSPYLPGSVGGGVNNAGGAGAHRPAVLCPDDVGAVMRRTMLVVDATLREVSKSIFGVSQLAQRERESWHGKLPVEMVVAGGADPVEHV